ncbi:MAG: hypothetical protein WCW02_04605 [Candidatus Buchananbacteria bacterium]
MWLYFKIGLIALAIMVLLAFDISALIALVSAAPWAPTRKKAFAAILRLAKLKPGQVVYELGSGDARVTELLAQTGARVVAFEYSLLPYLVSRWKIKHRKLTGVELKYQNFFTADFSQADLIYCYLTPYAMKKLTSKFMAELKPGTKIISFQFPLPQWPAQSVDQSFSGQAKIYLYQKN